MIELIHEILKSSAAVAQPGMTVPGLPMPGEQPEVQVDPRVEQAHKAQMAAQQQQAQVDQQQAQVQAQQQQAQAQAEAQQAQQQAQLEAQKAVTEKDLENAALKQKLELAKVEAQHASKMQKPTAVSNPFAGQLKSITKAISAASKAVSPSAMFTGTKQSDAPLPANPMVPDRGQNPLNTVSGAQPQAIRNPGVTLKEPGLLERSGDFLKGIGLGKSRNAQGKMRSDFNNYLEDNYGDENWNPNEAREAMLDRTGSREFQSDNVLSIENLVGDAQRAIATPLGYGVDFFRNVGRGALMKPLTNLSSGYEGMLEEHGNQVAQHGNNPLKWDLGKTWQAGGGQALGGLTGVAALPLAGRAGTVGAAWKGLGGATARFGLNKALPVAGMGLAAADGADTSGATGASGQPDPEQTWRDLDNWAYNPKEHFNMPEAFQNQGPYTAQALNQFGAMHPGMWAERPDIGRFSSPGMNTAFNHWLPTIDNMFLGGAVGNAYRPDTSQFQSPYSGGYFNNPYQPAFGQGPSGIPAGGYAMQNAGYDPATWLQFLRGGQ